MAEAVSQQAGRADPSHRVTLLERTGLEMVQVSAWRGASREVRDALAAALGVPPPEQPNTVSVRELTRIMWVGPDRWLILRPGDGGLTRELTARLSSAGAAVVESGAGRRMFTLSGPSARAVLAKHLPLDLSAPEFPVGHCAQSAMAHVGVLVHAEREETFVILVHRSFAQHLWEALIDAGLEFGVDVRPVNER